MIGNKYRYGFIDLSYILSRNVFAISSGKSVGEFNEGDVIRATIQTLNKLPRDYGITVDKFIFLRDTWGKDYGGYYRTYLLKGSYKSSREYVNDRYVAELKKKPGVTEEEIKTAELKNYTNKIKMAAKNGIINQLCKFGLPTISVEGWEYDDLAYLASMMLYGRGTKPSILITKDSDLQYSLSPQMDYFRLPTWGSAPEVITYDQMYETIPDSLKGKLTLYDYKSYLDSLGEGHNDMQKTKVPRANATAAIEKILEGDYSLVADVELFKKQLSTFDLAKFPRLHEATRIINEDLDTIGSLGSLVDFKMFCEETLLTGVSDKYFTEFISRFDQKLFGGSDE